MRARRCAFPQRTFRTFELEIRDTNLGQVINYGGVSPVGLRRDPAARRRAGRAQRPGQRGREDADATCSPRSAPRREDHPLVLLMNRERVIPVPPRSDPEESMVRAFALPTGRSFGLAGEARLSPFLPDDEIDRLLGYTGPVVATSSEHLSGAPQDRASAALDQDPATAWVTPFSDVTDQYVDVRLPAPVTVDHLDLQLVADGRHSVPTKIAITNERRRAARGRRPGGHGPGRAERGRGRAGAVPGDRRLGPARHRARGPRGHDARVVLRVRPHDAGRDRRARDAGRAGRCGSPPTIPDECRNDLITIDGRPVPVRVVGIDRRRADARNPLSTRQLHRRRRR